MLPLDVGEFVVIASLMIRAAVSPCSNSFSPRRKTTTDHASRKTINTLNET